MIRNWNEYSQHDPRGAAMVALRVFVQNLGDNGLHLAVVENGRGSRSLPCEDRTARFGGCSAGESHAARNSVGSSGMPCTFAASIIDKCRQSGIVPLTSQLLTVEGGTPNLAAIGLIPPNF